MGDVWFSDCADELARCLLDARACADACESYLGSFGPDAGERLRSAVDALAAPAAVSRVLIELIDQPPHLVLAAARLCHDLTAAAAAEVVDAPEVAAALLSAAASAAALLAAAR